VPSGLIMVLAFGIIFIMMGLSYGISGDLSTAQNPASCWILGLEFLRCKNSALSAKGGQAREPAASLPQPVPDRGVAGDLHSKAPAQGRPFEAQWHTGDFMGPTPCRISAGTCFAPARMPLSGGAGRVLHLGGRRRPTGCAVGGREAYAAIPNGSVEMRPPLLYFTYLTSSHLIDRAAVFFAVNLFLPRRRPCQNGGRVLF
jgi:hypothetical protein